MKKFPALFASKLSLSHPLLPLRREMGTQFEDISQRVADFSNNHRWENFGCKDTNLCFVLGLCGGIYFRIMFWIMFQDNAGGYDEYTGKVGSDGNEAGDKKKICRQKIL